jgi:hypothetical protein
VKMLYFVALTTRASTDEISDQLVASQHEGVAQPLQYLLVALMAHAVGVFQDLCLEFGRWW